MNKDKDHNKMIIMVLSQGLREKPSFIERRGKWIKMVPSDLISSLFLGPSRLGWECI